MPIGTTAAILAGTAIAGTAVSAVTGSKAAKAQERAASEASDVRLELFESAKELQKPFREKGIGALNLLSDIFVKGDTSKILEAPGIKFLRDEGVKALDRANAARGNFLSGAAVKEGIRFAEGLASTNLAQVTNPLFNLVGIGQNAASFTGQAAINTGAGVASDTRAAGNAKAAGFANIGSSINTGFNNALFGFLANQQGLFNPTGGT
jgi:hypothetical protein